MIYLHKNNPLKSEKGIALLLVLWALILLMTVIASFAFLTRTELEAGFHFKRRIKADFLLEGAINRAIAEIMYAQRNPDAEDVWDLNGTPNYYRADNRKITVIISPEASRVDLNRSSDVILRGLLASIGVDAEKADTIIDSILDWRDADDLHRLNGAENDYYQSLEPPYSCKNGDFDSVYELLYVKGVTEDIFFGSENKPGIRDFLTVNAGTAKIDINTAPIEVLLALPGMDRSHAEEIIRKRTEQVFKNMAEVKDTVGDIYAGIAPYIQLGRTNIYSVTANDQEINYGIRAVVMVSGNDFHIQRWEKPIIKRKKETSEETP